MKTQHTLLASVFLFNTILCTGPVVASEWAGHIGAEYRAFVNDPADPQQHDNNSSLFLQPEYFTDWDNGNQSFTFVPFARWDENDEERTHADIRELTWLKAANHGK